LIRHIPTPDGGVEEVGGSGDVVTGESPLDMPEDLDQHSR
jgi:hypothetical protein